jgi:hypothetical protein
VVAIKAWQMKIFIVLHHEIMGSLNKYRADEMVFYTTSSMKKALGLIKKSGVSRWSWWEIQMQDLDKAEWLEHVGYYGLRGGRLAKPPHKKCVEIFKRESRAR